MTPDVSRVRDGLRPPPAPAQSHREERALLPVFEGGPADNRLARARDFLRLLRAHLEGRHRAGLSGFSVSRLIAEGTDRLVTGVFTELAHELSTPDGIALIALGGYGRRESAPFSDVDLLLVRGPKTREDALRPLAQRFSTLLWDLKLTVGWNLRTVEESVRAADADHTVRTALVDARLLLGVPALFDELVRKAVREPLSRGAERFIADKTQELRARREKFGESVFLLEPNVKTGEGGLRDLEAALWIAFARHGTRGLRELQERSLLPADHVAQVMAARDFLMRVRNQLHFARGRKEDRLTFELQEDVAAFLRYSAVPEGLAVEQFMRHCYLSAQVIRRAADSLISKCEEESGARRTARSSSERSLGAFKVHRERITFASAAGPRRPAELIALYRTAEEQALPVLSAAREEAAALLDGLAAARGAPEVVDALKAAFARPGATGEAIARMHEDGVLNAVLPEFGRITALHQHDLYHVYTVDVHSLFALRRLCALRAGEYQAQEPELTALMARTADVLPLYLGMLLHDCGKGLGGNHSVRGQALAERVGERLRLTPRQREVTEHLVLHHLTLSQTAQRRDLSDPELIAQFAAQMGDVEKLEALYLLTYADMCSVAPGTWNEWRSRLIRELYQKARAHLLGDAAKASEGGAAFVVRWQQLLGAERATRIAQTLPERYFLATPLRQASLHARLLLRAARMPLVAFRQSARGQGVTEVSLCTQDRPGLLAGLAGVLSAHGIDILRAQITSTSDGLALDVFDVRGPQGGALDRRRWRAARGDLLRVIRNETTVEEVLARRKRPAPFARVLPKVPTRVSFDNQASRSASVIDVRAEDRTGLLFRIAKTLWDERVEITLAKIATEAHHAIDSFYVTRGGKKLTDPQEIEALVAALSAAVSDG